MFYDWASQPFHTLILTFVFAPYFVAMVAETPAKGQEIWGYAVAIGSVLIAVSAPVLGAIADSAGPRRPWILSFSALYVIGVSGLWFAAPGAQNPAAILIFFVIGLIGVEFTAVFTNSLLPMLAPKADLGRISGSGWALGYWGGLLALALVLGFLVPGPGGELTLFGLRPAFGLDPALGEGARATGPLSALWYVVFMIPFFLWAPDAPRKAGRAMDGLRQLRQTLASLPREPSFFAFLGASMFYRDALNGLYVFGGVFAAGVLGWGAFQLGVFGIVAALAGAVGAWAGGRADWRFGPKPVIVGGVVALILVSCAVVATGRNEVFFIGVGAPDAPSSLPSVVLYVSGAVIGAAGGALQSASRTMLVRQAASGRVTEAFGVYALAGKATSFLAPFFIALATGATGSQRAGVAPVILLFIIGLALMALVTRNGRE
ncbi:MFS transporter [Pikeienuella sp. HZG-20]|uniref:MFS transporter n=1 Tax=Paludibacillus litoralis TaxID=3133267 RepID=UPI0030EF173F